MTQRQYARHFAMAARVAAPADDVFALVDDHARLSAHMSRRSWAMGGGSMTVESDSARGQAVGSRLMLHGIVFGLRLFVEEAVVERTPPYRKVWETVGEPRLLVIGRYRMGFDIEQQGTSSLLTVFIDYDLPTRWTSRWLGALFGSGYARWCAARMANDAARHFAAEKRSAGNSS
jgi:hypothetical protein